MNRDESLFDSFSGSHPGIIKRILPGNEPDSPAWADQQTCGLLWGLGAHKEVFAGSRIDVCLRETVEKAGDTEIGKRKILQQNKEE